MNMKRTTFLALLCLFLWGAAYAQHNNKAKNAFSAKILFIDYGNPNAADSLNITNGLELGYIRNLTPWLNIVLPVKVGLANVVDDANNNRIFAGIDGILQFQFTRTEDSRLVPYLMGGGGLVWEDVLGTNFQIPLGAGVNVRAGGRSFVNFQAEYRISQENKRNNLQLGLGLVNYIGRVDTDGDGVADVLDLCPTEVGPANTGGCPDQDMDGVADSEDLCPTQPGKRRFQGCPDTDDDNVSDNEDECPETPGLVRLKGCPDRDKDGVADKDDDCPDEKGDLTANGCPDADSDGIADAVDECPNEIGLPEFNGCPFADRDKDRIPDDKDACPDKPGKASMSGCPDTDGDGVHDGIDACPEQKGPAANKGCPEVKKEDKEVLQFAMRAVQFETGKATLKEESSQVLNQIAEIMGRYTAYKLRISGHTDNVGEEDFNQKLSEDRAKACYDYLISKGVSAERINHAGFGETRPIDSNDRASGRTKNRRVEFELYIE